MLQITGLLFKKKKKNSPEKSQYSISKYIQSQGNDLKYCLT